MKRELSHLTDQVVEQGLATIVAGGCTHTAKLVLYIGEVDARKLFRAAAHSSMFSYCVDILHFSEPAAYKRIRVGRMARRFPAIYDALAENRVHLSGLILLKAYMTRRNVDELLAAVTHKSCREIKKLLAERYPQEDVATRVRALPRASTSAAQPADNASVHAVGDAQLAPRKVGNSNAELAAGIVRPVTQSSSVLRTEEGRTEVELSARTVDAPSRPAKVEPLAPRRYALHLTMSQEMHDKLRHAQALLSHALPSGDVPQVLERALDALIANLEKAQFAATDKPRQIRASANPRTIPAHVRRAVRERDGCQCTFVSESGQRCPERHFLEFDHIDPVARGGKATAERMRLRCRAHNQYEAEQTFGIKFIQDRRRESMRRSTVAREAHAGSE